MWWVLENKGAPLKYIKLIKDMQNRTVTSLRTSKFPIIIGLHQELALSPYLFTLGMDKLTKSTPEKVPWCILFGYDIVLVIETKNGVNAKLKFW